MLTIDAHSDLLNALHHHRLLGRKRVLAEDWIPGLQAGGVTLRLAAIYSESQFLPEMALRRALDLTSTFHEEIEESEQAVVCLNADDILAARAKGRVGFMLTMEGAEPLGSDPQLLRIFHRLGLRALGLTHSYRNYLADGTSYFTKRRGTEGGLSAQGVAFLELAEELGIVIDVSHLSDTGVADVLALAQKPFMASHSNARTIHDHPRNLTDGQIKAIADNGGVIGANAMQLLVGPGELDLYLDHIDHLVKIGGIDHVGLGPDFCDYLFPLMSAESRATLPSEGARPVEGFGADDEFLNIPKELNRRGYSPEDIEKIMGLNFLRLFGEILN